MFGKGVSEFSQFCFDGLFSYFLRCIFYITYWLICKHVIIFIFYYYSVSVASVAKCICLSEEYPYAEREKF